MTRSPIRLSRLLTPACTAGPTRGPRAGAVRARASLRPYRRGARPGRRVGWVADRLVEGCDRLPLTVVLDVQGGLPEDRWVVLELAESAIAVETQQRSDRTGRMIMIDMGRWSSAADGAEALLRHEHVVELFCGNSISTRQMICSTSAPLRYVLLSSFVVAWQTIRGDARPRRFRARKLGLWLDEPAVRAPLRTRRHDHVTWPAAIPDRLRPPRLATARGALDQMVTTVEG
jgi:hypothetical protein